MATSIKDIIKQRRSVRSYRDQALPEEELQALRDYIASVPIPLACPSRSACWTSSSTGCPVR